MLAIAKISAARNRHPEIIVSLSMSPADDYGVLDANGVGSGGGSPNVTPSVTPHGVLSVKPRPLQNEPSVVVLLCILQQC